MTFKIGDIVVLRSGGRGIIMSLADFTEAHDRLAAAMRNATRGQADTAVAWDGKLDDAEWNLLDVIADEDNPLTEISTKWDDSVESHNPTIGRLVSKGCVELGQVATGVLWPGKQSVEWTVDPDRFAVRATERGLAKLRDAPPRKTPTTDDAAAQTAEALGAHAHAAILQEFRAIQVMAVYTGDKETAAVIAWAIGQIESDPTQAAWFVDKSMDDIKAKMGEAK